MHVWEASVVPGQLAGDPDSDAYLCFHDLLVDSSFYLIDLGLSDLYAGDIPVKRGSFGFSRRAAHTHMCVMNDD
jgi:hypothetical protein